MYCESKEEVFLKKKFKEYYEKNKVTFDIEIDKREFGYGVYKRKIANRNLAFKTNFDMNLFLQQKAPLFFSYSNSYYNSPEKTPMQNKGWIKSDLIYEFDADEIYATCNKENGEWVCTKKFGENSFVEETGVEKKQWFLEKSLNEAKKQVFRLVEMLESDFDFNKENVKINFSGKAGYHVHLRNKEILNLNKKARIEIVDYITGHGIYFDNLGYDLDNLRIIKKSGGWNKKINKGLIEFFKKDKKEIASITNLALPKVSQLLKSRDDLINNLSKGLLYDVGARTNRTFWTSVLDYVVKTYLIPIDRQTSIDLNKIIRVPNTLHGDTGFIAKEISLEKLNEFNPFNDAIVFGNELIKVFVKEAPAFTLKGQEFGPFKEETVEVPLYCAIYLIGKGATLS